MFEQHRKGAKGHTDGNRLFYMNPPDDFAITPGTRAVVIADSRSSALRVSEAMYVASQRECPLRWRWRGGGGGVTDRERMGEQEGERDRVREGVRGTCTLLCARNLVLPVVYYV
jgi:hypothetical protein